MSNVYERFQNVFILFMKNIRKNIDYDEYIRLHEWVADIHISHLDENVFENFRIELHNLYNTLDKNEHFTQFINNINKLDITNPRLNNDNYLRNMVNPFINIENTLSPDYNRQLIDGLEYLIKYMENQY